jgi:TonB family protein
MPILACFVALVGVATLCAGQADLKPKREATAVLHQRVNDGCELVRAAKVLAYDKYDAIVVDGSSEEWYSPELSDSDFLEFASDVPAGFVKGARKSGFKTKQDAVSSVGAPAVVHVGGRTGECPTISDAVAAAETARQEQRHKVQSKLWSLMDRGVTPPERQQRVSAPEPSQRPTEPAGPKPKISHGTVVLLVLVGMDGHVHGVKVVAPLDPVLDADAARAVQRWDFGPARKNGLPVPVKIDVEVNFNPE